MLRIHLFGQARLLVDATPLKFNAPPKTLPLLAYLLLHRAERVKRETVAFTLWSDESESHARANLRRHLHQLHRALVPAGRDTLWLLSDGETIQWNPASPFWLDVAEFERLSAQPATLVEAIALYSGDLLENLYDDWLFYPREHLRNLYFADLNQLIRTARAGRDHTRAIAFAQQLLSRDPLREDTVRQLMALRYEAGDRAGALQEYEHFVTRLRDELAVDPMPETTMLFENIVRNTRLAPPAPTIDLSPAASQVTRPTLPFVGRETEMEQLRAAWSRAVRGRGSIVLIAGEAGIGKTRLASELAMQVEAEGARILWGSTAAAEHLPYQSLVEALRAAIPLLSALEIDPLWLAPVAALIPELRSRLTALPAPASLDPERERTRLFEALTRCLEGLAQPRPLLLILEDLHGAGAAMTAWLEFAASRVIQYSMLIVITYREEETPREHPLRGLRYRLQRANLATHLALGRLVPRAVENMVEQIAGSDSAGLAQRLYATSEGNPFFLTELIQNLIESGNVTEEKTTGRWHLASAEIESTPHTLHDAIRERVTRLTPGARHLAEVAAVAGLSFNTDLVRETAGWSEAQALDAVDELLDRQLVREVGGRSRYDYTFTHHLIQSIIYADIPEKDRQRRHRRVAKVIEELYPQQRDELASNLAEHFDRGDRPALAADYYAVAARGALAVYADAEALAYLSRALELVRAPRTRADILALRETIYARRGERAAQRADLDELDALASALGDEDLRCEVLRRQIRLQRALGDRPAEAALIESLAARAQAAYSPRWQAAALRERAAYHILVSQYAAASPYLERALAMYRSLDDGPSQVDCHCLRVEIAIWQGRFDQVQASLDQARVLGQGQESTNQSLLIQTLRAASAAAFTQQDFGAAQTLGQQMLDLCRTVGDREGEADAHSRLGVTAARLFRIQSAREHYKQADALYAVLGKRQGQAAVLINSGLLAANLLGRYAEGLEAFRKAQTLFESLNDLRGQAVSTLNLGMTAFYQCSFATAKSAAQRALELARSMTSPTLEASALANLGAAERELGELQVAIQHMQAGLAIRRALGQPAELGTDLCDLTLAYLRAGKLDAARQSADEMLSLHAKASESMVRPEYILWVAAQTRYALGDTERARDLLAQAYAQLKRKADAIPDAESRASFLEFRFNREISAAYEGNRY